MILLAKNKNKKENQYLRNKIIKNKIKILIIKMRMSLTIMKKINSKNN
jgi:hypothetical protein